MDAAGAACAHRHLLRRIEPLVKSESESVRNMARTVFGRAGQKPGIEQFIKEEPPRFDERVTQAYME